MMARERIKGYLISKRFRVYAKQPGGSRKYGKVSSAVRRLKGRPGVYLVYPVNSNNPVYVGSSTTNLYKTIIRHFQSWEGRVVYSKKPDKYRLRVVLLPKNATIDEVQAVERHLIKKHSPRDNTYQNYGRWNSKALADYWDELETEAERQVNKADKLPEIDLDDEEIPF